MSDPTRKPIALTLIFGEGKKVQKSLPGLYFWHVANELLEDLSPTSAKGYSREFLVLIAQATALEAMLNDEIAIACMTQFGPEHHEVYARPFLRMRFREKLVAVVPFVSKNQFLLKQDAADVAALFDLLARRNKCVHATAEFEAVPETGTVARTKQRPSGDHALTVTTRDLRRYQKALEVFVTAFVMKSDVGDFREGPILMRNPRADWMNGVTTAG